MDEKIVELSHGAGGKKTKELIEKVFLKSYGNPIIRKLEDSAEITVETSRLAFTTDAFVVSPRFFKGGDIGKLAVYGSANDLACKGAKLKYLALAFLLEEGFKLAELEQIACSISDAARKIGAIVVSGDTKVVERGKGDGIFISTCGLGEILYDDELSAERVHPGAKVIISGYIAQHEAAIISARENFTPPIESDLDLIWDTVCAILPYKPLIMRDPTRGGLATILNEIALAANVSIIIDEEVIPIKDEVKALADILGLDPLYMASEGQVVIFAEEDCANEIVNTIRKVKKNSSPSVIGTVYEGKGVYLKTKWGGTRPLPLLQGEQLPRIC